MRFDLRHLIFALLLAAPVACSSSTASVAVDLKTDLVPGREFNAVNVLLTLEGGSVRRDSAPATALDDFSAGRRVADLTEIPVPTNGRIEVSLLAADGSLVTRRTISIRVDGDAVVTVLVTRDCASVTCPGAGEPATYTECLGGRCVEPECTSVPRDPACPPDPDCEFPSDCPALSACAVPQCTSGVCFYSAGVCAPGQLCDVELGCVDIPDAGPGDAGSVDAGTVVEMDAGPSAMDAGVAPMDAGMDAGPRAMDAGMDAGVDAGPPDARLPDAGRDADPVTCTGAGMHCNADYTMCEDTLTNALHCGGCGIRCGTGETCSLGRCRCGTATGTPGGGSVCPGADFGCCGGSCISLLTTTNCGGCGDRCASGETCMADGHCYCGTRRGPLSGGQACGARESCNGSGRCTCGTIIGSAGNDACSSDCCPAASLCTNFNTDEANCGACGVVCMDPTPICGLSGCR